MSTGGTRAVVERQTRKHRVPRNSEQLQSKQSLCAAGGVSSPGPAEVSGTFPVDPDRTQIWHFSERFSDLENMSHYTIRK